ncbi:MAG: toxin [Acidobacteria bacterium]|nr:toxin [Acidobacteriota bacterium]
MGEKFAANPVTGTGSMSVPIVTSPGRSGFGPQLSLSYDSGSGNGPFGFGWSLSLPSIARKTDKGLPRYCDAEDSDVFILSGAEDLVPVYRQDLDGLWTAKHPACQRDPDGFWVRDQEGGLVIHEDERDGFRVRRYRPRIEGLVARIERWTKEGTGETHWRSITRDNVTTLYGKDDDSRIFNPSDGTRVFSWLICQSYDDKGNAIVYVYARENDAKVDRSQANERNRVRTANRYLKRIWYGNRKPNRDRATWQATDPRQLPSDTWVFEVVFDYDEGHYEEVDLSPAKPKANKHEYVLASPLPRSPWEVRPDPFSSYRAGVAELRTYRRVRRVLMFHHIPDLPTGEKGYDGLVRSTEFEYADLDYTKPITIEDELAHQGSTRFASFIRAVTQSGYVRDDTQGVVVRGGVPYSTYLKKSLPPLEFEYSKSTIQDQVLKLDAESLENLPGGLDGSTQWVDLEGEGVSGILKEEAGGWFYKPNLGGGRFGPLQTVASKPSMAALGQGRQQLLDLAGDGQLDLVTLAGSTPGFYERTYDEDWAPFRSFRQLPNIRWDDPNLRFVDLDGDGHADVLITEHDVFTWYPSLAEEGFGSARRVRQSWDEERGPHVVFADGTQSIYLADMCGDGLTDLVRIRNNEVCYWPLGGGKDGWFGPKVTLDNVRGFDHPDHFDHRRVRVADIDGSGTSDIIYLARDGVRLYFNQSGNRLSDARRLDSFPRVDNASSVTTADLFGNGTACLVWSSPLSANARQPLRCVDLMGSSSAFSRNDLVALPSLARKLTSPGRPVDSWLAGQLSGSTVAALATYHGVGTDPTPLQSALLQDLNRLLFGSSIYTPERFSGVGLRLETQTLVGQSPSGSDVVHLTRLLLEDAYPLELARFRCAKPHLLIKSVNNLGAETQVHYAPSTRFYLADKRGGRPWVTRLPFPVHVVERVVTRDRISGNQFVTRYAYHHGYFDGDAEREVRGFGMIEKWDTEEFAALNPGGQAPAGTNIEASSHVPPVLTKTWFHTGVYLGRAHVSNYFAGLLDANDAGEYYREPGLDNREASALLLDDTVLPDGLTLAEEREACRALKGSMLRQEVYALDGPGTAEYPHGHPYTVTEQNFTVRRLQPQGDNRHGIFFTHARESISYHYERDPADPRIGHALTLEVDEFGNVLKSAAVGYGRRKEIRLVDDERRVTKVPNPALNDLDPRDQEKQTKTLISYTENRSTNAVEADYDHRTPLPCESRTYEVTELIPPAEGNRFTFQEVLDAGTTATAIEYAKDPTAGRREKRLIEHVRTYYRRDNLAGPLPLGELHALASPFESYKLAFTPGLVAEVYGGRVGDAMLKDEGRYVHTEGDADWWIPSGQIFYSPNSGDASPRELAYARQHFFLPHRYRDPFHTNAVSTESLVSYDTYDLLVEETRDALGDVLGNRVTVGERNVDPVQPLVRRMQDYRVLQPALVMDPNRNLSAAAFDALGMVVGTAVMGKPEEVPVPGDRLTATFRRDLTQAEIDQFLANPRPIAATLLDDATTRSVYDLTAYWREPDPEQKTPAFAATLVRETHASEPVPVGGLRIKVSFSYSDGFGREIQKKIQAEPGPGPTRDPTGKIIAGADGQPVPTRKDMSPRWVGSGWTVFNNKGKPLRQYEPFFTDTHRFEFDVQIGVSPVLFYDPVERVVATLHPNHTWEKVVFDPWRQETWDVNDTVLVADPKTDTDVGDFFSRLTTANYLPTWHALRTNAANAAALAARYPDPADRTNETRTAEKTRVHAATPTVAHSDSLGRTFLTVARNKSKYSDTPSAAPPIEELHHTRIILDIEGNQREVIDAKDRVVMRCEYDMLGNRVHQASMEAGERWTLNDVAAKPLCAWDSRNHRLRTSYDPLRRPTGSFLQEGSAAELLVGRTTYGETRPNPEVANLRGQVVEILDQAGVAANTSFDFKGNSLRTQRQFARSAQSIPAYRTTVDWSAAVQLDTDTYSSRTRYDALNRPSQFIAPHSNQQGSTVNIIQKIYNEANLLEQVHAWLNQNAEPAGWLDPATANLHAVTNIDWDAKGQRRSIDRGCQDGRIIRTSYAYDPETFRLTHLYTRRGVDPLTGQAASFTNDCDNPQPPPATIAAPQNPPPGKSCGLQNLHYTYDPSGNITHIRDDALQTIYFKNKRVEPSAEYTYDAVYRLIEATGREHLGQVGGSPIPHSYNDAPRVGVLGGDLAGRFSPNDANVMGCYLERYAYDKVGNFRTMEHRGTDPVHPGWTRAYSHDEDSLTEPSIPAGAGTPAQPAKKSNRLSSTTVGGTTETYSTLGDGYDVHGNMLRMPHLQVMQWDFKDQLQMTQRQKVNVRDADGLHHQGERTWYVYDPAGQRVRKVTESGTGQVTNERIYLGGFEICRKNGVNPLVRETLHIMDDKERIALVETRTQGNEPGVPQQLPRYQFGNHLGSACLELDDHAQIISYEEYAPYGSTSYQAVRSQTETPKRYRYTGKERDEETGLYYHGARYYAGWIGRWIAADPAGPVVAPNVYAAMRNSPVTYKDDSGFEPQRHDRINFKSEVEKTPSHQRWQKGQAPPPAGSKSAPPAKGPPTAPIRVPSGGGPYVGVAELGVAGNRVPELPERPGLGRPATPLTTSEFIGPTPEVRWQVAIEAFPVAAANLYLLQESGKQSFESRRKERVATRASVLATLAPGEEARIDYFTRELNAKQTLEELGALKISVHSGVAPSDVADESEYIRRQMTRAEAEISDLEQQQGRCLSEAERQEILAAYPQAEAWNAEAERIEQEHEFEQRRIAQNEYLERQRQANPFFGLLESLVE